MAKADVPAIAWGPSFTFVTEFGLPLDNATAWSEPRNGEYVKAPSGEEDAWVVDHDQLLAGEVRRVPTDDESTPEVATGWDTSPNGWRLFLEYAREKKVFRWIPDKDTPGTFQPCVLVEPMQGAPQLEEDAERRFRLVIRSTDDSVFVGY